MKNKRFYLSYCRECSSSDNPELRWLELDDKTITCKSCGNVLDIVQCEDAPGIFYLEGEYERNSRKRKEGNKED